MYAFVLTGNFQLFHFDSCFPGKSRFPLPPSEISRLIVHPIYKYISSFYILGTYLYLLKHVAGSVIYPNLLRFRI